MFKFDFTKMTFHTCTVYSVQIVAVYNNIWPIEVSSSSLKAMCFPFKKSRCFSFGFQEPPGSPPVAPAGEAMITSVNDVMTFWLVVFLEHDFYSSIQLGIIIPIDIFCWKFWNMTFMFPYIGNVIIPIDKY